MFTQNEWVRLRRLGACKLVDACGVSAGLLTHDVCCCELEGCWGLGGFYCRVPV